MLSVSLANMADCKNKKKRFFSKIGHNGRPGGQEPPGAPVVTKLIE